MSWALVALISSILGAVIGAFFAGKAAGRAEASLDVIATNALQRQKQEDAAQVVRATVAQKKAEIDAEPRPNPTLQEMNDFLKRDKS